MSPGPTGSPAAETCPPPDREWLDRFVEHQDEAAFAALVQRHGPTVLRVCRSVLGDAHRAEDAFQATFLVLVRKASAIRQRKAIGSWLYKVAYRIALAARAGLALRQSREGRTAGREPTGPLAEITSRELATALDEELTQLSDCYRVPLILCLLEGATRDEAAARLGWSLSTLKRRLERGREVLRARLARRGLTLGAVLTAVLLLQDSAAATVPAVTVGVVSPQAGVLADGALRALSGSAARLALGLLLVLAGAAGIGTWGWHNTAAPPQVRQPPAPRPAASDPTPAPERKAPAYTTERYSDSPPGLLPEKKKFTLI